MKIYEYNKFKGGNVENVEFFPKQEINQGKGGKWEIIEPNNNIIIIKVFISMRTLKGKLPLFLWLPVV